jgi:hypothetical protein
MKLTKEVKDIYNEKYKPLKKKLKQTLEIKKTFQIHGSTSFSLMVIKSYGNKITIKSNGNKNHMETQNS